MNKSVRLEIPNDIPSPYDTYVGAEGENRNQNGRNINVAQDMAEILNLPYSGKYYNTKDRYFHALSTPITYLESNKLHIRSENDFYGSVFRHPEHSDKAMLHCTMDPGLCVPSFYSRVFAERVKDSVIPGFTAFTEVGAVDAFNKLRNMGHEVRVKLMGKSDGRGQTLINSVEELKTLIKSSSKEIYFNGIVLEANLYGNPDKTGSPTTMTVGRVKLGEDFCFYGTQVDLYKGGFKYGGCKIDLKRGELCSIDTATLDETTSIAIKNASIVLDAYGYLNPMISRGAMDVVCGYDAMGNRIIGATDFTGRIGGGTPAIVLGIEYLNKLGLSNMSVTAESELEYEPNPGRIIKPNERIYLDHKDLRIVGRIASIQEQ